MVSFSAIPPPLVIFPLVLVHASGTIHAHIWVRAHEPYFFCVWLYLLPRAVFYTRWESGCPISEFGNEFNTTLVQGKSVSKETNARHSRRGERKNLPWRCSNSGNCIPGAERNRLDIPRNKCDNTYHTPTKWTCTTRENAFLKCDALAPWIFSMVPLTLLVSPSLSIVSQRPSALGGHDSVRKKHILQMHWKGMSGFKIMGNGASFPLWMRPTWRPKCNSSALH